MSRKYPGGIISKTPPVLTGQTESSSAGGMWTLDDAANFKQQGLWPTAGIPGPDKFIENLFSTNLYTGNGSTQTITNGIDLAGKGGLVWCKSRSNATYHILTDSARGVPSSLYTNTTDAADNTTPYISAFNSNGFNVQFTGGSPTNTNAATYVSWTFRKQPKFFDVVTYTGSGNFDEVVSHNLGVVPAVIIIKCISSGSSDWIVRTTVIDGSNDVLVLNKTDAKFDSGVSNWTSTTFRTGGGIADGASGNTYVAYLFASNAGGFGLDGTENVITCGAFTTDGSGGAFVNLGYEPQWIMYKATTAAPYDNDWYIADTTRGWSIIKPNGYANRLAPNTAAGAQDSGSGYCTSTGFYYTNQSFVKTYMYIAIRRGPMAVPTDATKVFKPIAYAGTSSTINVTSPGFPVDAVISKQRQGNYARAAVIYDRIRGVNGTLYIDGTVAEQTVHNGVTSFASSTGYQLGDFQSVNSNATYDPASTFVNYAFRRAPKFMDIVYYTGNGGFSNGQAHSLGIRPELILHKARTSSESWLIGYGFSNAGDSYELSFNSTAGAVYMPSYETKLVAYPTFFSPYPRSGGANTSGTDYIVYLFATCPGVSKVGEYTGTGSINQINCGFTAGARFVMIKRTDTTGSWYIWDAARGIVAGNDPYSIWGVESSQEQSSDNIDPYAPGFELPASTPTGINVSGGTYIFLAIA